MPGLGRIRTPHVYVAAVAAFLALLGFESARMAAGQDPALATAPTATPAPAPEHEHAPDQGFGAAPAPAPPDQGARGQDLPETVPPPESRLS